MAALLSIDVGDYYRPGDRIEVDLDDNGDAYVVVDVETEEVPKSLHLSPRQARAFAAALVHCATEVER